MFIPVRSFARLLVALAGLWLAAAAAAQSSPSPYTYATRYDAAGRVTGTIAPDPDGSGSLHYPAVRNSYDARGNLIEVESGELSAWQSEAVAPASWGSAFTVYGTTLRTYDSQNRKVTETVKGSDGVAVSLVQYGYDSFGRLQCTAMRMNPAAYGSLPASACTLGAQGSYGPDRITRNVYDAAGQLLQVREGVGSAIESSEVTYSYTLNGLKKYVIDANGNRAELRYDGHDRQVRWVFPSPTRPSSFNDSTPANALATAGALNEADFEAYTYDANGNRTSLRKRDGRTIAYAYDYLDRLSTKTYPNGGARPVYYAYDLQGRQTRARFDSLSGEGMTYTYDGFGHLITETQAMDGASRTLTSNYDLDGNRTYLRYPDGNAISYYRDGLDRLYYSQASNGWPLFYPVFDAAQELSGLWRWSLGAGTWSQANGFGYDNAHRLSALTQDLAGGAYDFSTSFTRNPASQIVSRTRDNDVYAWTGQVGVSRGYTTNGLNQYTASGSASFTYDPNGNLTSDGTYTYTYDIENRLVSRTGGGTTVTLRYDPVGRLYEVNSSATGITRFLNDGDALVGEYNSSGTMLRRFVHGTDAGDDPLVWFEGPDLTTSGPRYFYADERGSIDAITDSSGNLIAIDTYDEYGIPGAGNQGRFQYTGQAWLPEIGMYYYKARLYSPTLGRFLQTDPIGYQDQLNLYAYVANDPVNQIDPSGNSIEDDPKASQPYLDDFRKNPSHAIAVLEAASMVVPASPELFATAGAAKAGVITKVVKFFNRLFGGRAKGEEVAKTVKVSRTAHPEAAAHIERAQAAGQPRTLTVDRAGAAARRRQALKDTPTQPGKHRDEYPPAMFEEGGQGASRAHIDPSDNTGSGASIGNQCRSVPNGGKITITVCD